MVHIVRNDAPPLQTVNLVSDEDRISTESSSDSASSRSSSSSDEAETASSSSSLSNFIEEDDGPQSLPKPTLTTWKPVKPRRKPIRTLRRKPRLDKIEADEERSSSTSSTSSDGVPPPNCEIDADREDDVEDASEKSSGSPKNSSKKSCPRRAVAPRSFHDALHKYVEPMSNAALQYTTRTMREIWNSDRDSEESEETPQDSSIAYVPTEQPRITEEPFTVGDRHPKSNAVRSRVPTVQPTMTEEPFPAKERYAKTKAARSRPRKRRTIRKVRTCHEDSSPVIPSDREEIQEFNDGRLNYAHEACVDQETIRNGEEPRRLLHWSGSDDDEPLSVIMKRMQVERNLQLADVPIMPQRASVEPQNSSVISIRPSCEIECIDLCSDEEYKISANQEEDEESDVQPASVPSVLNPINDDAHKNYSRTTAQEQNIVVDGLGNDEGEICASVQTMTAPSTAEGFHTSQEQRSYIERECDENPSPLATINRSEIHVRNAQKAATLPHSQSLQRGTGNDTENSLEERNAMVKTDTFKQKKSTVGIRSYPTQDSQGRKKIGDSNSTFLEHGFKSEEKGKFQSNQRSPLDTKDKDSKGKSRGFKHIPRFRGAMQRGAIIHRDVRENRVPKSEAEEQAWLQFIKAELRDIYQKFTTVSTVQTYVCANVDLRFPRQIVAGVGKLMGLEVESEEDGGGRKVVLRRRGSGAILGSEEAVETAAESFFRDAMKDLKAHKLVGKIKRGKRKRRDSTVGSKEEDIMDGAPPSKKQQGGREASKIKLKPKKE